jgi:hypothetical protein
MLAIVTVRLPYDKNRHSGNKRRGECPLNSSVQCTDTTGNHHSYIEAGKDLDDIGRKAVEKHGHVNRIEEIPAEVLGE